MRSLRTDTFARRAAEPGRRALRPGLLFLLVFVSVSLLFLSRLHHRYIDEIRLQIAEILAPALKAAVVPLEPVRRLSRRLGDYLDLAGEVDRLRQENQRLRGWEWRAIETERKYIQLSKLANVVEEPGIAFVSGRIVADSSGPFVRSAMMAIGRESGIRVGFPVVDSNGLVGRILETGAQASRVLLLTDINSRIPVQVGKAGHRALLQGDNGAMPKLSHLPPDASIEKGDDVFTSGVGGLYPRGLRIGTVVEDGTGYRVQPIARLDELEFVSVLQFESPGIGLVEEEAPLRPREAPARRAAQGMITGQGRP